MERKYDGRRLGRYNGQPCLRTNLHDRVRKGPRQDTYCRDPIELDNIEKKPFKKFDVKKDKKTITCYKCSKLGYIKKDYRLNTVQR